MTEKKNTTLRTVQTLFWRCIRSHSKDQQEPLKSSWAVLRRKVLRTFFRSEDVPLLPRVPSFRSAVHHSRLLAVLCDHGLSLGWWSPTMPLGCWWTYGSIQAILKHGPRSLAGCPSLRVPETQRRNESAGGPGHSGQDRGCIVWHLLFFLPLFVLQHLVIALPDTNSASHHVVQSNPLRDHAFIFTTPRLSLERLTAEYDNNHKPAIFWN